jgi:hypothetical protein
MLSSEYVDCNECNEKTNESVMIGHTPYCFNCVHKYCLIKCPTEVCDNTISLNGYNNTECDLDKFTCTLCNTIFCNECLIKQDSTIVCVECFYDNTADI